MKGRIIILKIETNGNADIFESKYLPKYDKINFRNDGIFLTVDEIDMNALEELVKHGKYVYNVLTGREIKCKHFKQEIIDKIKSAVIQGKGFHDIYTVEAGPVRITYMFDVWSGRDIDVTEFKSLNKHDKGKIFDYVINEM